MFNNNTVNGADNTKQVSTPQVGIGAPTNLAPKMDETKVNPQPTTATQPSASQPEDEMTKLTYEF